MGMIDARARHDFGGAGFDDKPAALADEGG